MRTAIYCSSRKTVPQAYRDDAATIGSYVARLGSTLVYGGLDLGMMKVVARAAKDAGGRIVGIVPIMRKNHINPINDENVLTLDLNDRKAKMVLLSDIFVVLPGGYGTLDEIISTFSFLTFTADKHKPIILLNTDGLYDPTLAQLQLMCDRQLMDPTTMQRIHVANDAQECCQIIGQHFHPLKHKTNNSDSLF